MIAKDAWGGKAKRHDHEISALRAKVKHGEITALEAASAPIINCIKLNKSHKRPPHVEPPEQIDMREIWGVA